MAPRLPLNGYVLGLDVGEKRIGAAIASVIARLPRPLDTVQAGDGAYESIAELIKKEDVVIVVVGIPRNMQGEETAQSRSIREFAEGLRQALDIPIEFADESLSSKRADELVASKSFPDASQDSLAACFILEEFFNTLNTINEGVS